MNIAFFYYGRGSLGYAMANALIPSPLQLCCWWCSTKASFGMTFRRVKNAFRRVNKHFLKPLSFDLDNQRMLWNFYWHSTWSVLEKHFVVQKSSQTHSKLESANKRTCRAMVRVDPFGTEPDSQMGHHLSWRMNPYNWTEKSPNLALLQIPIWVGSGPPSPRWPPSRWPAPTLIPTRSSRCAFSGPNPTCPSANGCGWGTVPCSCY